jgi:hypothetical protein
MVYFIAFSGTSMDDIEWGWISLEFDMDTLLYTYNKSISFAPRAKQDGLENQDQNEGSVYRYSMYGLPWVR